jgi:hypothetical protein
MPEIRKTPEPEEKGSGKRREREPGKFPKLETYHSDFPFI